MYKAIDQEISIIRNMNTQDQPASFDMNVRVNASLLKVELNLHKSEFRKFMFICPMLLAMIFMLNAQQSGFIPLFDGRSLDGWIVRSGSATYRVEDGTIVGTTVEGSGNTFLCTLKEYSDFIFEFEVIFDPELNSGVQFRSHAYDKETEVTGADGNKRKFPAGRVFGYQFEIATDGSGGVYDEARRAVFISGKNKATAVIYANGWNRCRIIAQGDHFITSVNGVVIADFHDTADAKGFFGLQVHQVPKGTKPLTVRWRNLNIRELKPDEKL